MVDFFDKPLTLGDAVDRLGLGEGIIAEFPNGKHRYLNRYSRLDKIDAALPIDRCYKHDPASKTYHVKIAKYRPGPCDGMIEIKPRNSHYGIDPIAHMKECDEFNPISQMKNIREWYGLLYDRYNKIKRIICDGPATIIFWDDGTKTVVKAQEEFDYEKGILYAALKKLATKKEYDNILRAIDKVDETCKNDPVFEEKETPKKKREYKYQKCPVCGKGYNLNWYRTSRLSSQGFVDIRCSQCDTLFRVKGNMSESKWHTKLKHDVLIKGGDK